MHLTRGGEEGRTGDTSPVSSVLAMPLMLYAQHTDTQRQTAKRSTLLSIKALKILKELHKVKRRFLLFRCYKGFYFYIPKCSWCGRHAVILRLTLRLRRSPADMSLAGSDAATMSSVALSLRSMDCSVAVCPFTACLTSSNFVKILSSSFELPLL